VSIWGPLYFAHDCPKKHWIGLSHGTNAAQVRPILVHIPTRRAPIFPRRFGRLSRVGVPTDMVQVETQSRARPRASRGSRVLDFHIKPGYPRFFGGEGFSEVKTGNLRAGAKRKFLFSSSYLGVRLHVQEATIPKRLAVPIKRTGDI
jgi:hypothetical protein